MEVLKSELPAAAPPPPAAQGLTVVYVTVPSSPSVVERYLHRQSVGLGVAHIIIGALCICFNIVAIVLDSVGYYYYGDGVGIVGHGIWTGVLFVVTGALGITAGKTKTKCKIVSFMVMCIISASLTIVLLSVGIIGAFISSNSLSYCANDNYYYYGYSGNCGYYGCYPLYQPPCPQMPRYKTLIAMESLLAIFGVIEAVVAIWAAANCCKGYCCCSRPAHQTVGLQLPANYLPNGNNAGHMIYWNQTQNTEPVNFMMPYNQAGAAPPYNYSECYAHASGQLMPVTMNSDATGGLQVAAPPTYTSSEVIKESSGN